MNLESLIVDFTELNDSIAAAAHGDDDALLYRLDADIQDLFGEILAFAPETKEQRIAYCKFLLDQLVPAITRHGTSHHICEKILQLVSEA